MRCPYCAEEVKDDAVVCKHCQRELFVIKPLLEKIKELNARLAAFEKNESPPEPKIAALNHTHQHPHGRHFNFGLNATLSVVSAYLVLIAIHYLLIWKFDARLIYYQFTSIAVPILFGGLYRPSERLSVGTGLLLGVLIAVAATGTELAIVWSVDNVPFWPQTSQQWKETLLHGASIAFGFLTGTIIRNVLEVTYLPNAKFNHTIDWTARFIMDQFGDGKNRFTLKTMRSMVSSILGLTSAIVSIATGLWEYLLKN